MLETQPRTSSVTSTLMPANITDPTDASVNAGAAAKGALLHEGSTV